jgi:hypothetical protein
VPNGYWPLIVMDNINTRGAAGIHEDRNGQPFASITASSVLDQWSLTASHEALEMLVDPWGNRLVAGDSPKSDQARVSFLVEVSDPSVNPDNAKFRAGCTRPQPNVCPVRAKMADVPVAASNRRRITSQ